jgi:hypothetical protein
VALAGVGVSQNLRCALGFVVGEVADLRAGECGTKSIFGIRDDAADIEAFIVQLVEVLSADVVVEGVLLV